MKSLLALFFLALVSCSVEQERKVARPESSVNVLPWNAQLPGEAQGQFGALQNQ